MKKGGYEHLFYDRLFNASVMIYTPRLKSEMKNTRRNVCSDIFFLIRCPMAIPITAGSKAEVDKAPSSTVKKLLLCKANARATVDTVKSIPMA